MAEQNRGKWLKDNIVGIFMLTLLGIIGYLMKEGIKSFDSRMVKVESKVDTLYNWEGKFVGPEGSIYRGMLDNMDRSKKNEREINDHNGRIIRLETMEGIKSSTNKKF